MAEPKKEKKRILADCLDDETSTEDPANGTNEAGLMPAVQCEEQKFAFSEELAEAEPAARYNAD
jgi:hypothetical protein